MHHPRGCGATDNAPDYGSGDSRFESWHPRPSFGRVVQGSLVSAGWAFEQFGDGSVPVIVGLQGKSRYAVACFCGKS